MCSAAPALSRLASTRACTVTCAPDSHAAAPLPTQVPLLAPSQPLLSAWHRSLALLGHKGPGNVPWRRSAEQRRVPFDGWAWLAHDQHAWFSTSATQGADGCAFDPNDACAEALGEWLPLAEPYTWPHVTTFGSIAELLGVTRMLLSNATRRREISSRMKTFFADESERAAGHARVSLHRALQAATELRLATPRTSSIDLRPLGAEASSPDGESHHGHGRRKGLGSKPKPKRNKLLTRTSKSLSDGDGTVYRQSPDHEP